MTSRSTCSRPLHNLGYLEFLAGTCPRPWPRWMRRPLDRGLSRGISHLDRARLLVEAGMTREADAASPRPCAPPRRPVRAGCRRGRVGARRVRAARRRHPCRPPVRGRARPVPPARERPVAARRRTRPVAERPGGRSPGQPADRACRSVCARSCARRAPLRGRTASLIAVEAMLAPAAGRPGATPLPGSAAAARDPITTRLHGRFVSARVALARGDRAAARRRPAWAGRTRRLPGPVRQHRSRGRRRRCTAAARRARPGLALGSGRPAVFAAAERARAVVDPVAARGPPEDAAAAELLAQLRRTAESLRGVEQDRAAARRLTPPPRTGRDHRPRMDAAGSGAGRAAAGRRGSCRTGRRDDGVLRRGRRGRSTASSRLPGSAVHRGRCRRIYEQVRRARADLDVLAPPCCPAGCTPVQRVVHPLDGRARRGRAAALACRVGSW